MCTIYSPITPIKPIECDVRTIESRLQEAFPHAYGVIDKMVKDKNVILCGSVVAAASHCREEDWQKILPLLKKSDLDVFYPGEETEDWLSSIHGLFSHCDECYWYKRGRVVEMEIGDDRVQLIHTATTGPRAGCSGTALEILGSFDMTHLQVGYHSAHGPLTTKVHREYLANGVSHVVSPDVLIKRVKKNVARGYPVSVHAEVTARGLQGYDGSNWKKPAPLGESEKDHLCDAPVDPMDKNIKSIPVNRAMNMNMKVAKPVKYRLHLKQLQETESALRWLEENPLSNGAASMFWKVAMMCVTDVDQYQWVSLTNGRTTPASDWCPNAHRSAICTEVLDVKPVATPSLAIQRGPKYVTITPLGSAQLPAIYKVDRDSSTVEGILPEFIFKKDGSSTAIQRHEYSVEETALILEKVKLYISDDESEEEPSPERMRETMGANARRVPVLHSEVEEKPTPVEETDYFSSDDDSSCYQDGRVDYDYWGWY